MPDNPPPPCNVKTHLCIFYYFDNKELKSKNEVFRFLLLVVDIP